MARLREMFQVLTATGVAVTIGDVTVSPVSQSLVIRWPNGGLVWNRPVAILVEREGETQRIPIIDATRLAQIGLLGLSIVFAVGVSILSTRRRRNRNG